MTSPQCPECGVAVPSGVSPSGCPACLLRIGLEPDFERESRGKVGPELNPDPSTIQIGPYRLVRILGEGGMGTVWLAEQWAPVRREVALKLVREGIVALESLERFELERQVLERLDHPGIARLLDAGRTMEGRPYFVMERVVGGPLTDYCQDRKLGVRERIELFLQIGEAVEYAHQRAVIHRDLKPVNVLVEERPRPRVRVIDFGIAKVLIDPLTDVTELTVAGRQIGTPSYMSPEQACGGTVDTRSDIYSLGAILFELLTGERLITPESLDGAPPDEIYRRIREEEAVKPSTRIDRIPRDLQKDRADDFSEPFERWQRQVLGDLDWIVLKALEKDPSRRYQSVGNFADDLQRFLHDEVIEARPPSVSYRCRKFFKRQRSLALAILLATVSLIAAVALSTRWAIRAESAARLAEDRLLEADAVPTFLFDAFRLPNASPDRSGMLAVDVLDYAAERAPGEFANQPVIQGRILEAIGQTYFDLGFYDKANDVLSQAEKVTRPVSETTADLRGRLSQLHSGALRLDRKPNEALAASEQNWREAIALRGNGSPEEITARHEYTMALMSVGDIEGAAILVAEVRGNRTRYPVEKTGSFEDLHALIESAQGNVAQALSHYEKRMQERLGLSLVDGDKNFMWTLRYYGSFLQANGRAKESVQWTEILTRVCEKIYGPRHHITGEAYARLSLLYQSTGAPSAAWLVSRLHTEEYPTAGSSPDSGNDRQNLPSPKDPGRGEANRLEPWLAIAIADPASTPDLPPGIEEAETWFVLGEFRARSGATEGASSAYHRGLEMISLQTRKSGDEDRPRHARYLELLLRQGKYDEVETAILSRIPSFDPTNLAERLYLEPLSELISKLDLSGETVRARDLDFQMMSACAGFGAHHTGRFLRSYDRLLKVALETKNADTILQFHEEVFRIVKSTLPSNHSLVETLWLRLAEFQNGNGQIESALSTLNEIETSLDDSDRSEDAPIRFSVRLLKSECFLRKGSFSEAEQLLSCLENSLDSRIPIQQTSGVTSDEKKWRSRIARNKGEIIRLRKTLVEP